MPQKLPLPTIDSPAAQPAIDPPATLSVEEAAKVLGIGRNSAYDAVKRGEIPSLRIGVLIRVPRVRLMKMLEEA